MQTKRKSCIEHRKDTEQIMEDVKELKSTMYGNGNKGVKERVTIVETNFEAAIGSIKIMGAILGIIQILIGIAISIVTIIINAGKAH